MIIEFAGFTLDTERRELRRTGEPEPVPVEPQAFDLITHLASHPDRVIDRDELIANVWRGRIVSDAAISTRISAARRALDDDGRAQRIIRTVPRRGFRFVASTTPVPATESAPVVPCFVIATPRPARLLHDLDGIPATGAAATAEAVMLETAGGRVHHSVGGELHALFDAPVVALAAALDVLQASAAPDAAAKRAERVTWRIVLGASDAEAHAMLQRTAPGTVVVSATVHAALDDTSRARLRPLDGDDRTPTAYLAEPRGGPLTPRGHPAPHCRGLDLPLPARPSIVILPFANLGGDDGDAHLAIGIRLDVQTALVKISGLFVIAAGPANSYATREVPTAQVGREMGVRYVLEGSTQRAGRRLRVTAQLTDTRDRQVVWAERYDRSLDDPLEVQDEITREVVTALDVKLAGGEQARVWRKTLRDPQALDWFYRGLDRFMRMTPEDLVAARGLFERVHERAPDVALGPTYLAICHWWEATRGWSASASVSLDEAGRWGERAVAMEDADGQAHGILAHVLVHRGRHDEALRVGAEGVAIRPLCANTNAFYASVLNYSGFHAEAVERMRSAIRFAPIYAPWWLTVLAAAYCHAGAHDLAFAVTREARRLDPHGVDACLLGAAACTTAGWGSEARMLVDDALAAAPALTANTWCAGQPYRDAATRAGLARALTLAGLPA